MKPPRTLGVLLAILGIGMIAGGFKLVMMGDNAYFVFVGAGVVLSGVFISLGKLLGAYVYGATLALVVVWSYLEVGINWEELLPRIVVPILVGIYIFSGNVRARLA